MQVPYGLDKTKISYVSRPHSSCSMIVLGVYPPGTTMAQVEELVKGTFGGRFARFSGGEFEYVAYTD